MDIHRLRAFCETIEHGSFADAAHILKLSEAGVRKQIRVLEQELGHALFTNISQRLVLTEKGKRFFDYATKILNLIKQAETDLAHDETEGQSISILTTISFASNLLISAMKTYLESFDGKTIKIALYDALPDIRTGAYAICIWPKSQLGKNYEELPLKTFETGLYASNDYIKKNGTPKNWQDLRNHKLVAYPNDIEWPYPEVNWFLEQGTETLDSFLQINSGIAIIRAIEHGLAIGSTTVTGALMLDQKKLVHVLPKIKGPSLDLCFYYDKALISETRALKLYEILKISLAKV